MPIDLKTVQRTAELSRLNLAYGLNEEQAREHLEKISRELVGIVGHIDILSEADTKNVEPLYSPMLEAPGPRPDQPRDSEEVEDILNQAPDRIGNYFAVPKIL